MHRPMKAQHKKMSRSIEYFNDNKRKNLMNSESSGDSKSKHSGSSCSSDGESDPEIKSKPELDEPLSVHSEDLAFVEVTEKYRPGCRPPIPELGVTGSRGLHVRIPHYLQFE